MPLSVVAEVVSQGGYLPQLAELREKKTIWTRRNGVGFSIIWCLFFLLIMAPLWGIMGADELAGVSAIIGIFGGLIMLISSLIFLKKPYKPFGQHQFQQDPAALYGRSQQAALPPQQSTPVSAYRQPGVGAWRDTKDLVPQSVTESTTRLLNEKESEHDSFRCPTCNTSYTDRSLKFCLVDGAPLAISSETQTKVRRTNELPEK
jgi:hypothetical protein